MRMVPVIILLAILVDSPAALARDWKCVVCGKPIDEKVYVATDKVTGEKKDLCEKCIHLPTACYLCGMPVMDDFKELPDGRILCARDVKSVVLDATEAGRICREVKDALDRRFSRFTSFPENVSIQLADRVDILEMFRFPGNDFECPNVWGYTQRRTNDNRASYVVSVLAGLPAPMLKATAAHEFTHAWIWENVPLGRQKQLDRDATEGFCELVSYLLMDAQNEESAKASILTNAYTRGQARLFLEAERKFSFNEVIEWVNCGEDDRLIEDDLGRVRRVTTAKPKTAPVSTILFVAAPVRIPDKLVLKSVSGPPNRRFALINDRTFAPQEMGKVRVGQSNLLIRCVAIRTNSAVVQVEGTGENQELFLDAN